MSKHKHAEVIHAWAEGYTVQRLHYPCCTTDRKDAIWGDCKYPQWLEENEYRVKPMEQEYSDPE